MKALNAHQEFLLFPISRYSLDLELVRSRQLPLCNSASPYLRKADFDSILLREHAVDHRFHGSHLPTVSAEVVIAAVAPPVPTALRVG